MPKLDTIDVHVGVWPMLWLRVLPWLRRICLCSLCTHGKAPARPRLALQRHSLRHLWLLGPAPHPKGRRRMLQVSGLNALVSGLNGFG